jgi:hypothetical protein
LTIRYKGIMKKIRDIIQNNEMVMNIKQSLKSIVTLG